MVLKCTCASAICPRCIDVAAAPRSVLAIRCRRRSLASTPLLASASGLKGSHESVALLAGGDWCSCSAQ